MPYYRVYLLDEQARIESGYDLVCQSDEDARREAEAMTLGRAWELWSGTKKVASGEVESAERSRAEARQTTSD